MILQSIFSTLNCVHPKSQTVLDGDEAVETYEKSIARECSCGPFKLILLDNQMPIMDGPTAAQIIREKHGDSVKIVMISGDNYEDEK